MTEEQQQPEQSTFDLIMNQSAKIGELLDYNQALVKLQRNRAGDWQLIGKAYAELSEMAFEIADNCALITRISADRVGDIISAEWGIEEVAVDLEDEDDEED